MDEWMEKYIDAFGEGFPMYQVGRGRTEEETIKIIRECIEKKKDAYELGYATDDNEIFY